MGNYCECGMVGYNYGVGNCPNCDDIVSLGEELLDIISVPPQPDHPLHDLLKKKNDTTSSEETLGGPNEGLW